MVNLALTDPEPVVAYTAGVGLVKQGTPEALMQALKVAGQTGLPHLQREILKAVGRMAHTAEGKKLLCECFSSLNWLGKLYEK